MITVIPKGGEAVVVEPTRFPDGTSQVWKLPQHVLDAEKVTIDWRFQDERELMTLASLKQLLDRSKGPWPHVHLRVPFLPYGRQDKHVNNESTFNLRVFARFLNMLEFEKVVTFDVHSDIAGEYIDRLQVIPADNLVELAVQDFKPDVVVFPDAGAAARYSDYPGLFDLPKLAFRKRRDQATGEILGHEVDTEFRSEVGTPTSARRYLIVDDLCDGGATSVSVARAIRAAASNEADGSDLDIGLYVTHGLFSKGLLPLREGGIKSVFTTDSVPMRGRPLPKDGEITIYEV